MTKVTRSIGWWPLPATSGQLCVTAVAVWQRLWAGGVDVLQLRYSNLLIIDLIILSTAQCITNRAALMSSWLKCHNGLSWRSIKTVEDWEEDHAPCVSVHGPLQSRCLPSGGRSWQLLLSVGEWSTSFRVLTCVISWEEPCGFFFLSVCMVHLIQSACTVCWNEWSSLLVCAWSTWYKVLALFVGMNGLLF